MKSISQHTLLVAGLCGLSFALLVGEYLLLAWYPEWLGRVEISPSLLSKLNQVMPYLRIGTPVLYVLTLVTIAFDPLIETRSKPTSLTPPKWGLALCAGLCLASMIFIWKLPDMSRFGWRYGYPIAILILCTTIPLLVGEVFPRKTWGIQNPRRKLKSKLGFYLRLHNGWINIVAPIRGMLVVGGPGSGKSYSVVEPIIEQAVSKKYTAVIYDFKFPTLAEVAYAALLREPNHETTCYIVNFTDLSRTHRVNPLEPKNMPTLAYAVEYAQAIMSNLVPESIIRPDFWLRSSVALLTATIWFLKKYHPRQCTLPHAVALICQGDFKRLLKILEVDPETASLVASLTVAMDNEADKQLAGVLATIQNSLAQLNTPEIAWVMSESDFNLDINDPDDKKILVIGNDADLPDALAPPISLIITVALKRMNRPGRHHSLLLLDEAPTLHIPKLELIPATGRSNKIATVYVTQDISQMVKSMGRTNADVLLGTLSTQIFGKASNHRTAEYVSAMFGKEDKETITRHQNRPSGSQGLGMHQSLSFQQRETPLLRPQEVIDLSLGEFAGITAGTHNQWFRGSIQRKKRRIPEALPVFVTGFDITRNFERIHDEARSILGL